MLDSPASRILGKRRPSRRSHRLDVEASLDRWRGLHGISPVPGASGAWQPAADFDAMVPRHDGRLKKGRFQLRGPLGEDRSPAVTDAPAEVEKRMADRGSAGSAAPFRTAGTSDAQRARRRAFVAGSEQDAGREARREKRVLPFGESVRASAETSLLPVVRSHRRSLPIRSRHRRLHDTDLRPLPAPGVE